MKMNKLKSTLMGIGLALGLGACVPTTVEGDLEAQVTPAAEVAQELPEEKYSPEQMEKIMVKKREMLENLGKTNKDLAKKMADHMRDEFGSKDKLEETLIAVYPGPDGYSYSVELYKMHNVNALLGITRYLSNGVPRLAVNDVNADGKLYDDKIHPLRADDVESPEGVSYFKRHGLIVPDDSDFKHEDEKLENRLQMQLLYQDMLRRALSAIPVEKELPQEVSRRPTIGKLVDMISDYAKTYGTKTEKGYAKTFEIKDGSLELLYLGDQKVAFGLLITARDNDGNVKFKVSDLGPDGSLFCNPFKELSDDAIGLEGIYTGSGQNMTHTRPREKVDETYHALLYKVATLIKQDIERQ
jgi:hypothetical protein